MKTYAAILIVLCLAAPAQAQGRMTWALVLWWGNAMTVLAEYSSSSSCDVAKGKAEDSIRPTHGTGNDQRFVQCVAIYKHNRVDKL